MIESMRSMMNWKRVVAVAVFAMVPIWACDQGAVPTGGLPPPQPLPLQPLPLQLLLPHPLPWCPFVQWRILVFDSPLELSYSSHRRSLVKMAYWLSNFPIKPELTGTERCFAL